MTQDRDRPAWRGHLFDAALALPPEERTAFLDGACAGDAELRRELDVLLAAVDRPQVRPSLTPGATSRLVDPPDRAHLVGWTLGPYQVEELIGRGSMGEVYVARDVRLDRRVALKLLPAQFTSDSVRVSRFEEEARAASALNHPGILTVYDVGDLGGVRFMATEFVAGTTLRERVSRGPLPPAGVLDIGMQIAEALAAAHASNIVHRDIKPENVMVRPDGLVKILDFGVAKLSELASESDTRRRPDDHPPAVARRQPDKPFSEPETFFDTSWSPDGRLLGGSRAFARPSTGVIVYSFESSAYEVLTESGRRAWLPDNRRLLYFDGSKLMLVDRVTKEVRTLIDLAPETIEAIAVSGDGTQAYVAVATGEADLWRATLQ